MHVVWGEELKPFSVLIGHGKGALLSAALVAMVCVQGNSGVEWVCGGHSWIACKTWLFIATLRAAF